MWGLYKCQNIDSLRENYDRLLEENERNNKTIGNFEYIISRKEREIARLTTKLKYYEAIVKGYSLLNGLHLLSDIDDDTIS